MAKGYRTITSTRLLVLAVILAGILVLNGDKILNGIQEQADSAMNQTMAALANPTDVAINGNKAVTYYTNEGDKKSTPTFSDRYIPDELLASTPEEARYILYITRSAYIVGQYGTTGGFATQQSVKAEVLDRTTNTIVSYKIFYGSAPASSSRGGIGRSGGEASAREIRDWIRTTLTAINSRPVDTSGQTGITVHARVPEGWEQPGCWAWSSETGEDVFAAWPGEEMGITGNWYTIDLPGWVNYVIINANDGTAQTADLSVEKGRDLWLLVYGPDDVGVFYEEPAE